LIEHSLDVGALELNQKLLKLRYRHIRTTGGHPMTAAASAYQPQQILGMKIPGHDVLPAKAS